MRVSTWPRRASPHADLRSGFLGVEFRLSARTLCQRLLGVNRFCRQQLDGQAPGDCDGAGSKSSWHLTKTLTHANRDDERLADPPGLDLRACARLGCPSPAAPAARCRAGLGGHYRTSHRTSQNSSTVIPAWRIKARSVPFATVRWFGTTSRRCGATSTRLPGSMLL
jgi:hypothetical protein